jgi:hypothetical protein
MASSSSSSKQDIERYVGHCVTHLQDHASHYLSLIQSKRVEGVLWAVFRVGERLLPQGVQQGVELHKASFLALSSMVSSKADVLLRMQRDCDQDRQFVCWFTLDDAKGSSALASKVLTIDAGAPASTDDEPHASREPPANETSALSQFRRRHDRAAGQRSSSRDPDDHSAAASLVSTAFPASSVAAVPRQQRQHGGNFHDEQRPATESTRPRSPRTVRDLLAAVAKSSAAPGKQPDYQAAPPVAAPQSAEVSTPAADANVTMLMRMVMQVADSVASMGAAMDQLSLRCVSMETEIKDLKERIHLVELPMFGDDYHFNAASSPSSRVGHTGADGQRPHVAWQTNQNESGNNSSKQKRALLSASEMLIQLTELSLRVGETENRVRVLESSREAAELQRKILHEQVDGLKIRMSDFVKSTQRLHESSGLLSSRDAPPSRHYTADSDSPARSSEYPWRQHQQPPASQPTSEDQRSEQQARDVHRKWSNSATAASSSIAAATRMMDSPFNGYAPPLSTHSTRRTPVEGSLVREESALIGDSRNASQQQGPSSTGDDYYQQTTFSTTESHQHFQSGNMNVQQRTTQPPQGALSDMIRSLETKLGGIRSAR